MSASGLETNEYQDLQTLPGVTFAFNFDFTPLDLTGATAAITISGIGVNGADLTLPLVVTVLNAGVYPTSILSLTYAAASTTGWLVGAYKYQILVTFVDGTVLPYGTGMVVVR